MARKQITTVRLVRRPHQDAKHRLWLAYTHLIEESWPEALPQEDKKEKVHQLQEVES